MTLEEINDESLRLQREELRRRYAMAALTGLLSSPTWHYGVGDTLKQSRSDTVDEAWKIAAEMMEWEKL